MGWEFLFVQLVKTLEVFVRKNPLASLIPYAFKNFEYAIPGAKKFVKSRNRSLSLLTQVKELFFVIFMPLDRSYGGVSKDSS